MTHYTAVSINNEMRSNVAVHGGVGTAAATAASPSVFYLSSDAVQ